MALEKQAFLGRFVLNTGGNLQITINNGGAGSPATITLDEDEYFPAGYTGESPDQFVEHVTTKIQAVSGFGAGDKCELVIDGTNAGKLQFTWGTASCAVTWVDTTLRDWMGFSQGNLSSAASHVADDDFRFVWFPSYCVARLPANLTEWWEFRSTTMTPTSVDGSAHGREGETQFFADIGYSILPSSEVLIPAGAGADGNGTFERMFREVFHKTSECRIMPDRSAGATNTAYESDDYKVGRFGTPDDSPLGGLRDWISPSWGEKSHDAWNVNLYFHEYTGT